MEQKNMVTIRQALNGCIKSLISITEAVEILEDRMKEFEAMKARLKELDPIMAAEKPEVNAQ